MPNHLKQLALGCLEHEAAQGFLPTAGWEWAYQGDPDLGFDSRQPGGWIYNVMPYIEQQTLHDMGMGMDPTGKAAAQKEVARPRWQSSIARPAVPLLRIPMTMASKSPAAHTDYAGNSGTVLIYGWIPGWALPSASTYTGVFYPTSTMRIVQITDGASTTYLLGEKYLTPDNYYNGHDQGDNQPAYNGFDPDYNRFCVGTLVGGTMQYPAPNQDRPGSDDWIGFGGRPCRRFQHGAVRRFRPTDQLLDQHDHPRQPVQPHGRPGD